MRKLVSIRKIADIRPIEGADAIECVVVDGWTVVAKKGQFQVGELCVYFEIDSVLPIREEFEYLRKACYIKKDWLPAGEGFRLKTIRLRGQLSQGLVMPIVPLCDNIDSELFEGLDVTYPMGVIKYDPPLPACLEGQAEGHFPTFIRKTDQERAQNLTEEIRAAYESKEYFEATIKLDGSSGTFFCKDAVVGVCSRNLHLKINDENKGNSFVRSGTDTGLLAALNSYGKNIAVQGEIMGPGIQGNRENLPQVKLFVFDIFDIDKQEYLNAERRADVINDLVMLGANIAVAPVMCMGPLPYGDVDSLLRLADGPSLNHKVREGIVWKSLERQFSFKTISNEFLLKGGD